MTWLGERIRKDTKFTGWNPRLSGLSDKVAAPLSLWLGLGHWSCRRSNHILTWRFVSCSVDFSGTIPPWKLSGCLTALMIQDLTQWTQYIVITMNLGNCVGSPSETSLWVFQVSRPSLGHKPRAALQQTEGLRDLSSCSITLGIAIMSLSQNDEHQANFQRASTAISLKPDELYYAYLLLNYPCRCLRCPTRAKAVLALKSTQSDLRLEMTALQGTGPGEGPCSTRNLNAHLSQRSVYWLSTAVTQGWGDWWAEEFLKNLLLLLNWMLWCSCIDTLRDTDQTFRNHDFMSVEWCNFILVNVLALCSNSKGMECVLMSVSIPWETQPLWLLRCLLFPPSPLPYSLPHISFFMLWSPWLSTTLQYLGIWPQTSGMFTDSGKRALISVTLLPSAEQCFPTLQVQMHFCRAADVLLEPWMPAPGFGATEVTRIYCWFPQRFLKECVSLPAFWGCHVHLKSSSACPVFIIQQYMGKLLQL